jgi:predicted translin family RNA/ssDNA-binding protein
MGRFIKKPDLTGAMINTKEFARIRKALEDSSAVYEEVLKQVREILKLSKKIIYSVHRKGDASADVKVISDKIAILRKSIKPEFLSQLKIAEQEYVEAVCLYEFVKSGSIPDAKDLGVTDSHYLLGLCDLSGEMTRLAINAAIDGDSKTALKVRDFVENLYDELMQFDFANGELRKKFDGIKYDLKRLEEVALQLKR